MAAQASWASEAPVINHTAPFEIENVTPAKVALDSDELCGSGLPRIPGNNIALRRVLGMVRTVAPTDATVLINGETGTGKELIAEAIELFGHERGAYTGPVMRTIGWSSELSEVPCF